MARWPKAMPRLVPTAIPMARAEWFGRVAQVDLFLFLMMEATGRCLAVFADRLVVSRVAARGSCNIS